MYYIPAMYPYPYYANALPYHPYFLARNPMYKTALGNYEVLSNEEGGVPLKDYGTKPFVVNIEKAAEQNNTFRTALWTGKHLQVTLMSIGVGEDIGLEIHPTVDQFLRIEEGQGLVQMGDQKDQLNFKQNVYEDYAIMVPAGKWHNLTNTGTKPLKLYTIYAPPQHPYGTVHKTKADAIAAEERHIND